MTSTQCKKALRDLGMSLRRTQYGEWRVNFANGNESTAYYTDDIDDAYETGLAMAQERKEVV